MSDRWDWDTPELGDEAERDETEPVRESPGGWPEEDEQSRRERHGGWPDDDPESGTDAPGEWSGSTWGEPPYTRTPSDRQPTRYSGYEDYGYRQREDVYAEEAEADRFAGRPSRDPLARLFPGLPRGLRVTLDWVLTIAGAILIVLALKQWVVNPYRIPSSSMEPALNCAKPAAGCLGDSSDRVLACRVCLDFGPPSRGDIVVFNTPSEAANKCGEGGTFVKRVIGLPGETVHEDKHGFIWIRGPTSKTFVKLKEPYISRQDRLADATHFRQTWPEVNGHPGRIPPGNYFMMGDNRGQSCDSRTWGTVPRNKLIGIVFFVYWPPDRIGFR
jgi:signal peptidase I